MPNRHLLRTIIMQTLYESEFHESDDLDGIAQRHLQKAGHPGETPAYVAQTLAGLKQHSKEIDKLITKHAPEWPLEQIAGIDRAVLRLGVYEVLYSDEVPPKVAINEAVELGKNYGGDNSGSFVNGVLGTIYRASDQYDAKADKNPSHG